MQPPENRPITRFEIILGVAVVAVVALAALPLLQHGGGLRNHQKAMRGAENIALAVGDYRNETGRWPESDQGILDLGCLTTSGRSGQRVGTAIQLMGTAGAEVARHSLVQVRPWLDEVPLDPWFRPYHAYVVSAEGILPSGRYGTARPDPDTVVLVVLSAGADGTIQTDLTQIWDDQLVAHIDAGISGQLALGPESLGGDDLGIALTRFPDGGTR